MIYYNSQNEAWEDENDDSFSVGMTPEGSWTEEGAAELAQEFETQEDFWKWYNN